MKKNYIIIGVIAVLLVGGFFAFGSPKKTQGEKEMVFYYLPGCGWCQKVKSEGTISKLEALGIKVTQIDASVGPVKHKFQGVPTFVVKGKVYTGYKTFEELKGLLGVDGDSGFQVSPSSEKEFTGDPGEQAVLENGYAEINAGNFKISQARFFNSEIDGKKVYFFIVKDKDGNFRAAGNACQVCFGEKKGFRQEGNEMVCNNCQNSYPLEKIGTEKGGCNPYPISSDLEVENGFVKIPQEKLAEIKDLF